MSKDLVIIGGGVGGSLAAIRASRFGKDVAVIEESKWGGCCLNTGCIPGKSLVHFSNIFHEASNSSDIGIEGDLDYDFSKNIEWRKETVEMLRKSLKKTFDREEIDYREGKASFSSSEEIVITSENWKESMEFDKAIIATGSKPVEIPSVPFGHEDVLSSAEFLALEKLPNHLLVIGAGYVGMEFGMVCSKLGVDVSIIEEKNQILPGWDKRLVRPVKKKADELDIDFHFGYRATNLESENSHTLIEAETETGETKEFSVDKCLVAVGREPYTDGLNLENTNVKISEDGTIETDEVKETTDSGIYAIGDVEGHPMLAHKAFRDAVIVSDYIADRETSSDYIIPEIVFTEPEFARVGTYPSESSSREKVGKAFFRSVGASHTKNKTEGFARIVIDDGVIIGADVVGPRASELIHEFSILIGNNLTVEDVLDSVIGHPTLSEIVVKAVEDVEDSPPYLL